MKLPNPAKASKTLRASGPANPEEAWDRYLHPARWSEWSPQITRVETVERLVAGATGTVFGPAGFRLPFEVDAVDEAARTWSWRVHFGPIRLRLEHAVSPAPAGCVTTLAVHGPLPVILAYAPLAQVALDRLVQP